MQRVGSGDGKLTASIAPTGDYLLLNSPYGVVSKELGTLQMDSCPLNSILEARLHKDSRSQSSIRVRS